MLVQLFERRTLTYTPSNAPAWQVEMGNAGRHYFAWCYGVYECAMGGAVLEPLCKGVTNGK